MTAAVDRHVGINRSNILPEATAKKMRPELS